MGGREAEAGSAWPTALSPGLCQNCMVMAEQNQVWVGSEDSVIYIINVHSMSCNKQLTDHRSSVTDLAVQSGTPRYRRALWRGKGPWGSGVGGEPRAGGAHSHGGRLPAGAGPAT